MQLTDAQVLAQLNYRRVKLLIELERVELAIKAFTDVKPEDYNELDLLPYTVMAVEDIHDDEIALSKLTYNPRHSAQKKILFVLSRLAQADAMEISQYLMRIDPLLKSLDRVYNRTTHVASRLYKAGKIGADRVGNKNVYKLLI